MNTSTLADANKVRCCFLFCFSSSFICYFTEIYLSATQAVALFLIKLKTITEADKPTAAQASMNRLNLVIGGLSICY